jgi:hypothetical protein
VSKRQRIQLGVGCLAVIWLAALFLAQHGTYGWTLFMLLPAIAGAVGTWIFRPATVGHAMQIGAAIGVLACCFFLFLGAEGLICVVMAIPVVVPLAMAGSLLAYWARAVGNPTHPAAMALLLPLSLFYDGTAKPPVYSLTTNEAPPQTDEMYRATVAA